jgi:hypothetical protein
MLKAIQARKPKATAQAFLEVLHKACQLLPGTHFGKTIALADLRNVDFAARHERGL